MNWAIPPVATTVARLPSSSSTRSSMPSSMAAVPYMMPLRMQSTVFLPITRPGRSRRMPGSWAAREVRASREVRTPGMMQPPR